MKQLVMAAVVLIAMPLALLLGLSVRGVLVQRKFAPMFARPGRNKPA